MPTQSSALSPSDSPADRLHVPCFLSRNSHLSCRSFLLLPLPLLSPLLFFPLSLPPLVRLYVCRTAPILCFYGFLRSPLSPGGGSKPAGQ